MVNPKRIYRLYKETDLQLRNKVPKRRVKAKLRADRTEATHSNHVSAYHKGVVLGFSKPTDNSYIESSAPSA